MQNIINTAKSKFSAITTSVLGRHGGSPEEQNARIERVFAENRELSADSYAMRHFTVDTLKEEFPNARILGVVGTPVADAPITSVTRWGSKGVYVSPREGYIQISLLQGEKANVSLVDHHPETGEAVIGEVLRVQQLSNIKIFGSTFANDDLAAEAFDAMFEAITDLKVGEYLDKRTKKKKSIFKGTELTMFMQFAEMPHKEADGSLKMVVSCIAIIDTQPKAVTVGARGLSMGFFGTSHKEVERKATNSTVNTVEDVVNRSIGDTDHKIEGFAEGGVLDIGQSPI